MAEQQRLSVLASNVPYRILNEDEADAFREVNLFVKEGIPDIFEVFPELGRLSLTYVTDEFVEGEWFELDGPDSLVLQEIDGVRRVILSKLDESGVTRVFWAEVSVNEDASEVFYSRVGVSYERGDSRICGLTIEDGASFSAQVLAHFFVDQDSSTISTIDNVGLATWFATYNGSYSGIHGM